MLPHSSTSEHPRCGNCGYNLTGSTSNRCPECGLLFIEAGVVVRRGGRRRSIGRRVLLALGLLSLPIIAMLGLTLYLRAEAAAARAAQRARVRAAEAQALRTLLAQASDGSATTRPASQPGAQTIRRER